MDPEDLYQLGCVGFLKAIEGFDESFGTRFSTYAVPKISGEIRRFLRDDGAVKVSRGIKEQGMQLRAARVELEQRLGREPTISELSRRSEARSVKNRGSAAQICKYVRSAYHRARFLLFFARSYCFFCLIRSFPQLY